MKRSIEEYFPIVEINRLAVPERNAFKPIYKMHKWFARRSSSVFRAILLGALKPAGTDIMEEFYKDHTHDPDTNDRVILDPFMGGGTTVVEALRLGCRVIGIDLNPVAWFIVKTEVEPVDLEELQAAFERLAQRKVAWSGKPLKETLLDLYKTECPACGNKNADIIYTFWVKSAPCTTATCQAYTPLFNNYIIAQKKPSIRYFPDSQCPQCKNKFDWELEPAALVGEPDLMVNAAQFSAGEGRTSARWNYSPTINVECPWCHEIVKPQPQSSKPKRKRVPLTVLLCPHCEQVWQFRGPLSDEVQCPACGHSYHPGEGNIPAKGKFICRGTCGGNVDKIITAIRTLPEDQLLPLRPYAMEGYCSVCAQAGKPDAKKMTPPDTPALLWKNNGKFFKRVTSADLKRYQDASAVWQREKSHLPYPKSEIPEGYNTNQMIKHNYRYWYQMFNDRQLLALSTLLQAIDAEEDQVLKEMLLSAFYNMLNNVSDFTSYRVTVRAARQVFARHDFQPKTTPCEINVWGIKHGMGSFVSLWESIVEGKKYNLNPFDRRISHDKESKKIVNVSREEKINGKINDNTALYSQSSSNLGFLKNTDFVITDPPYASNVNYSELADYFYVWLRLILKKEYAHFAPELTPKAEEVIENATRGKTSHDFQAGLEKVFHEACKLLNDDGLLVFTFHHAEDRTWEALLAALFNAGYYLEAVYPIHGEAESSLHLMGKEAISYDLIHVCRKRTESSHPQKRSWAGVRHEIRRRAREEARLIESGRYGSEPLAPMDMNLLLIGKCLELYSKHYGAIVDYQDNPVPLKQALAEIRMLVDQLVSREHPLPPELENIDPPSYVYFTTLCTRKEIKSDEVSKSTRGIVETAVLREHGLIIKGREKRGRTFEVKQPIERLNDLKQKFNKKSEAMQLDIFAENGDLQLPDNRLFVDYVHFLLGMAEAGDNVFPWLERFRGLRPQLRAALEYLMARNTPFVASARKILNLIDERTLFNSGD